MEEDARAKVSVRPEHIAKTTPSNAIPLTNADKTTVDILGGGVALVEERFPTRAAMIEVAAFYAETFSE